MGGALGLTVLSSVAATYTASNTSIGKLTATVIGYQHAFIIAVMLVIFATILGSILIVEKKKPREEKHQSSTTPVLAD